MLTVKREAGDFKEKSTMTTDHEIYEILKQNPELIILLSGLPEKKGVKYTFESITKKGIELRLDGILLPNTSKETILTCEFVAQTPKVDPYENIFHKYLMVRNHYKNREVICILIFLFPSLDPKTTPWVYLKDLHPTRLIVLYLNEKLEEIEIKDPTHPLVLVFKVLLTKDNSEIEKECPKWYNDLQKRKMPGPKKKVFEKVFFRWLIGRFTRKSIEELEDMIGITKEIEKSRAYKEIL